MKRSVLFVAAVSLLGFALQAAAVTPGEIRVKKAIADQMTPAELAAYKQKMAERVNAGAFDRANANSPILTPADTCTAATPEISTLPYNGAADTTVGAGRHLRPPGRHHQPDLRAWAPPAPARARRRSLPFGAIYNGTGTAPDRAYRIQTSANCTLTITATPTSAWDLALEPVPDQLLQQPRRLRLRRRHRPGRRRRIRHPERGGRHRLLRGGRRLLGTGATPRAPRAPSTSASPAPAAPWSRSSCRASKSARSDLTRPLPRLASSERPRSRGLFPLWRVFLSGRFGGSVAVLLK